MSQYPTEVGYYRTVVCNNMVFYLAKEIFGSGNPVKEYSLENAGRQLFQQGSL